MADSSEGLATATSMSDPAALPEFSSATVGPMGVTDSCAPSRPHGPRAERPADKQEKKVSPDPFYRTDRYRLVTPYSLARDPSRT